MIECGRCHRHVRASDETCPFCEGPKLSTRLMNVVGGALTTLVLAACYGTVDGKTEFYTGDTGDTDTDTTPSETGGTGASTGDTGHTGGGSGSPGGTGHTGGTGVPGGTGSTGETGAPR